MRPEEIAAEFDATWVDWAVQWGGWSWEYIAFPTWPGAAVVGFITAKDPCVLEDQMTAITSASGRSASVTHFPEASPSTAAGRPGVSTPTDPPRPQVHPSVRSQAWPALTGHDAQTA